MSKLVKKACFYFKFSNLHYTASFSTQLYTVLSKQTQQKILTNLQT